MVYAATKTKYQILIRWQLVLKEFGPNINPVDGVYNIVSDTISRLLSTTIDIEDPSTTKVLSRANNFFATRFDKTFEDGYPLDLVLLHQ